MKKTWAIFWLAFALALVAARPALAARDMDAPIPLSPQVRTGKLENGLTYYVMKNARPAHAVELRLVVRAGSILEDDDQQGLAHVVEHMAFNGSTHFRKQQLISFLQSIGVKFGADLNAYTGFNETVYILPIPVNRKGTLDKGMEVLEDWAGGLTFDPAEVERERGVVLEEARLGKGADDRMDKVIWPRLYEGSRYADRLPIGKEAIVRNADVATLRRFYADWYRPDLMAVVAVGDLDPARTEALIRRHFAGLKNPAHERARLEAPIPPRTSDAAVVASDPEASDNMLFIKFWTERDRGETTLADYRQALIRAMFNQMLANRLYELTQQDRPPFTFGTASTGLGDLGYMYFSGFALVGKDGPAAAIEALVRENRRAAQFGFTAGELERMRKTTLRSYEQAYAERAKGESGSYAAEFIRNFLQHEPIPGIANEYAYVKEFLPGITLDELNRFAQDTIARQDKLLVTYRGAARAGTRQPAPDELLGAVAAARQQALQAYAEAPVAAALMAAPPKGGTIVEERRDRRLGITDLTLGNGVRVVLKPTRFKNDQILMNATRPGGESLYGDADMLNARYASAIVTAMGASRFSAPELQKMLAGRAVSVTPAITSLAEGMGGQAGQADLETLLQLTYLYFTAPRRDAQAYQSWRARNRDLIKDQFAQPSTRFYDDYLKTLYGGHPRGPRVLTEAQFDAIDGERAQAIYRERFASARGFTFVLVGSFDVEKIKPLLRAYLGTLPGGEIASAARDLGLRPVRGVVKKELHVGLEQKSTIALTFAGPAHYSLDEATRMGVLTEVLNIRLNERLRQAMGAVYSASASGTVTKLPYENYQITLWIPCGPENVDRLLAAVMEEIDTLKRHGPRPADLNKVRTNALKQYREGIATNESWLYTLSESAAFGDGFGNLLTAQRRLRALTPAALQATAQRYFDMHNYLQEVLYPAAAVAARP